MSDLYGAIALELPAMTRCVECDELWPEGDLEMGICPVCLEDD